MSKISPTGRARIARALELTELCIHHQYPVDSSNTNLIPNSSLPKLPRLKDRNGSELAHRNRYINYQYRFLYQVLVNWQKECPERTLYFVTVTFNQKTDNRYLAKESPASEFGASLREKLNTRNFSGRYFFVLEKERAAESKLHMHMLCVCDDSNKDVLKKVVDSYADSTNSAVRIQTDYLQPHSAKKYVTVMKDGVATKVISAEWGQLEDDDDSQYELNSTGNKWQIRLPINVGAADYMSKHDKVWKKETGSRCMHAPKPMIQEANKLHVSHKKTEVSL